MDTDNQYLEMKKQMTELKKAMKKQAKDFFRQSSKDIFEKHIVLESFRWTQYTPYFNDGDECVFSANKEYPYLNGSDEEFSDWAEGDKADPLYKAGKAVIKLLKTFDDDDYKTMFGDHCQVTVTAKGVDVESYDHD